MGWLTNFYNHLSLQSKLRSCFVLLILLPSIVICVVYYGVSSKSIFDIAEKNILDVVEKNTQVIDKQLQYAQTSAMNLNVDADLFSVLNNIQNDSDSVLLEKDKIVKSLMSRYFPGDNIISATIMTERYVLGFNGELVIPSKEFFDSQFYNKIKVKKGEPQWIPSYQVLDTFGLDYMVNTPNVFSVVQVLTPILFDSCSCVVMQRLPEDTPDSVLMVNFHDDLFRNMFENSISTEGAFYCISSLSGNIVSHSDSEKIGLHENLPWLDDILTQKNGYTIQKYGNEEMLVCYSVSDVTGWVFAVVTPVSGLLNNVSKLQTLTLLLLIVLLVLAMLFSTVFSRRITLPVERLVAALHQTGKGNFNLRLPTNGYDELQYLTEKFNEMSSEIQILVKENYESEIRNKESEIMALNLQLTPHFLYNTLNTINMMVLVDTPIQTSKMIVCLSDMLQYTFKNKQELVLFEEEYLWLQNYIYIMSNRFEGKFKVIYQVEPELFCYKVPKLLLQPLVENAIVHGFMTMKEGGILCIRGWQEEGDMYLEVKDNGTGMSAERIEEVMQSDYNRIGLSNTIRRLHLIYGESGGMRLESSQQKGTQITVHFPLKS